MSALPARAGTTQVTRVLSQANVRIQTDPIRVGVRDEAHSHDPVINVVRRGDRVHQIEIRCGCGQLIQLECDY